MLIGATKYCNKTFHSLSPNNRHCFNTRPKKSAQYLQIYYRQNRSVTAKRPTDRSQSFRTAHWFCIRSHFLEIHAVLLIDTEWMTELLTSVTVPAIFKIYVAKTRSTVLLLCYNLIDLTHLYLAEKLCTS